MFSFLEDKSKPDLLNRNWEGIMAQLKGYDPKDNCSYMITLDKGTPNEHRTRFMNYTEMMDLVFMALEKKKLRVSSPTP